MSSSPPADRDIEFAAVIADDGTLSFEYERSDAAEVQAFTSRADAPGGAPARGRDARATSGAPPRSISSTATTEPASATISVDQAAALLDLDRNTLYEALGRGEGPPARRIGRVYRLARESVLAWLKEGDKPMPPGRRGAR